MSLEELNGPILHLALSIKEGHGFGFLQTPFVVVASTSNLHLETEPIQPCSDPVIRTDLAWETDKKSLRGFRTSNTPVKIECFSLLNDVKRDRIGYILLNIKSAQVVPNGKHTKLLEKSHRLINVPQEAKLMKPELLLCLKITEANAPVSKCPSSSSGLSKALPGSPQSGRAPSYPPQLPQDAPPLPIFRPDENLVQIGPQDSCTDTFVFTLNIDKVGNLSLLTPKKADLPADALKSIHIKCAIFSTILSTRTVVGDSVISDSGDSRLADERMQVRLLSSIPMLFRYFRENPTCTLQLLVGGREIAAAEVDLTPLLRSANRASFVKDDRSSCSKSLRCSWISSFSATIPAAPSGGKPFVDVTTRLHFAEDVMDEKKQHTNSNSEIQIPVESLAQWTENASFATETSFQGSEPTIDGSKLTVVENNTINVLSTESNEDALPGSDAEDKRFRISALSDFYPNRSGTLNLKGAGSSPFRSVNLLADNNTALRKYCLRVSLRSVVFDRVPVSQRLRFRFEYPNGHVLTSSISDVVRPSHSEALELADMDATIVLHASPSVLLAEVGAGAVEVTVAEVDNDPASSTPFARAFLSLSTVCLPGKVESSSTAILEGISSRLRLGVIEAHLNLEDCGPRLLSSVRFQPHMPHSPVIKGSPPIPPSPGNSEAARRTNAELQEWKHKQMEIFTVELKEKEAMFLERASEMWNERKRQIEENLNNNMAQCRSLSEALSAAREELSQRSNRCTQKEQELNQLKENLERQYSVKFQELTLAAQQLDEELKMKIIRTETKCHELEDQVKALSTENEKLHQELLAKSAEVELQSSGLNQQQAAKLLRQVKQLEEKLQVSMKSKAYFKEQWGRAIREANLSRTSNFETPFVGSSLINAEETLSPFVGKGLQHILLQEEEELRRDSEALELLRRQIGDVCKRKIDV